MIFLHVQHLLLESRFGLQDIILGFFHESDFERSLRFDLVLFLTLFHSLESLILHLKLFKFRGTELSGLRLNWLFRFVHLKKSQLFVSVLSEGIVLGWVSECLITREFFFDHPFQHSIVREVFIKLQ